ADVRQADERTLLRHAPRRGSAGAPVGAHRGVPYDLRRRVRQPLSAVLSSERVRDDPGRRGPAAADQRVELRPLQDVRHHGPVPGHHVGHAGRCRRPAVRWNVTEPAWRASILKRFQAAAIAAVGYPAVAALGATFKWRSEGLQHLDTIRAAGHPPIMAFWHGRILPATYFFRRRGIVVITSENF